MLGSAIVYSGLILTFLGAILVVRPSRRLRIRTRVQALVVALGGLGLVAIGFLLPAPESRITLAQSLLDRFVPVWQFHESHSIRIDAPPARVYDAIKQVRADEIAGFRLLTWIRRGGRELPAGIMNAGTREPLIDLATRTSFVRLADEAPSELVIGTVVVAPPGSGDSLTREVFHRDLPPGFALAAMNFRVQPDGAGGSIVSTETRVFANSQSARRRFAAYWRVIYPGSALIRRMWLRAVKQRATAS